MATDLIAIKKRIEEYCDKLKSITEKSAPFSIEDECLVCSIFTDIRIIDIIEISEYSFTTEMPELIGELTYLKTNLNRFNFQISFTNQNIKKCNLKKIKDVDELADKNLRQALNLAEDALVKTGFLWRLIRNYNFYYLKTKLPKIRYFPYCGLKIKKIIRAQRKNYKNNFSNGANELP